MHRYGRSLIGALMTAWLLAMPVHAATPGEGGTVIQTVGTVVPIMAQVAATGNVNINNPGTAVFDGVTLPNPAGVTSSLPRGTNEHLRRVLLWRQTNTAQNGIYLFNGSSSALTRAPDMNTRAHFRPNRPIEVLQGVQWARQQFYVANTDYPANLTTTALSIQPQSTSVPLGAEQLITAIGVTSQIDCGANDVVSRTVRIRSAVPAEPVTIGTNPAIKPGSDGQRCIIRGGDNTETVTVPNEFGVLWGGGDVTFGAETAVEVLYVAELSAWLPIGGVSGSTGPGTSTDDLDDVHARGGTITNATVLNPFKLKDPNSAAVYQIYWSGGVLTIEKLGADGLPMDQNFYVASGRSLIFNCGGAECERLTGAGVHSYSGVGKPTKSIFFPAGSLSTDGTNCGAVTEQILNSGPKMWAFQCADNGVFYGSVSMLRTGWDAGPVQFTLHVFHGTTETITFAGDFRAQCRGDSDPINNTWSAISASSAADVAITTANDTERQTTGDITPEGTCQAGDWINWHYFVDAAAHNAPNARVIGVSMHYKLKSKDGLDE